MPIKPFIIHSLSFAISCVLLTSYFLEGRTKTTRARPASLLPSFLRRTPAPVKTADPLTLGPKVNIREKLHDKRIFDQFVHNINIFTHPKVNQASKTQAATQMMKLINKLKTEAFKSRAKRQLRNHGLTKQTLEKEIHSGTSIDEFASLLSKHQDKKERNKDAKLSGTAKEKLLTIYAKALNPFHKAQAQKLLRKNNLSMNDLRKS